MTDNIIHLAGRVPSPPHDAVAWPRGKKGHAPFYPTASVLVGQRESRLSERSPADRSWAAQAGIHSPVQGDRLSHSFSTRAALNLAPIAKAMLDVASGLFIAVFGLLYFLSPFIALGCLFLA